MSELRVTLKIPTTVSIPSITGFDYVATGRPPVPGEHFIRYNADMKKWSDCHPASHFYKALGADNVVILRRRQVKRVIFTSTNETRPPKVGEWFTNCAGNYCCAVETLFNAYEIFTRTEELV